MPPDAATIRPRYSPRYSPVCRCKARHKRQVRGIGVRSARVTVLPITLSFVHEGWVRSRGCGQLACPGHGGKRDHGVAHSLSRAPAERHLRAVPRQRAPGVPRSSPSPGRIRPVLLPRSSESRPGATGAQYPWRSRRLPLGWPPSCPCESRIVPHGQISRPRQLM
jgi:hypothetical protein